VFRRGIGPSQCRIRLNAGCAPHPLAQPAPAVLQRNSESYASSTEGPQVSSLFHRARTARQLLLGRLPRFQKRVTTTTDVSGKKHGLRDPNPRLADQDRFRPNARYVCGPVSGSRSAGPANDVVVGTQKLPASGSPQFYGGTVQPAEEWIIHVLEHLNARPWRSSGRQKDV